MEGRAWGHLGVDHAKGALALVVRGRPRGKGITSGGQAVMYPPNPLRIPMRMHARSEADTDTAMRAHPTCNPFGFLQRCSVSRDPLGALHPALRPSTVCRHAASVTLGRELGISSSSGSLSPIAWQTAEGNGGGRPMSSDPHSRAVRWIKGI